MGSVVTDRMRSLIGRPLETMTSFPIERGEIRRWATAAHYPDPPPPRYWDEASPEARERGGIVAPADFKLMLLHYPDLVYPAAAAGADVCLAGHTHGGQICWPDGSPILRHDTLPAPLTTGVHRIHGTWMVVNRGIGKAGLRVRMFCPAHAIMVTLRHDAAPESSAPGSA